MKMEKMKMKKMKIVLSVFVCMASMSFGDLLLVKTPNPVLSNTTGDYILDSNTTYRLRRNGGFDATLGDASMTVVGLEFGFASTDNNSGLTIGAGQTLNSSIFMSIGTQSNMYLNVNGTLNATTVKTGNKTESTTVLTVSSSGVMNVSGEYSAKNNANQILNINGGTVTLGGLNLENNSSSLASINLTNGGTLIITGDYVDYLNSLANLTGDKTIVFNGTNTIATSVIPEPVTLGLISAFGGAILFFRRMSER